jgi:hypothetical protein
MKTTCTQHRFVGFTLKKGVLICLSCEMPQVQHETMEETVARRDAEKAVA